MGVVGNPTGYLFHIYLYPPPKNHYCLFKTLHHGQNLRMGSIATVPFKVGAWKTRELSLSWQLLMKAKALLVFNFSLLA